jgi:6-phosphogluconolactonase
MTSPAHAATFAYVGNTDSSEIHVMRLDRRSGTLALVEKVAIPGLTKPATSTPMAVSPDRKVTPKHLARAGLVYRQAVAARP